MVLVILLGIGALLYRFVMDQKASLEQMEFSTGLQEGLPESKKQVHFDEDMPFTLLIASADLQEKKWMVNSVTIMRYSPGQALNLLSLHPMVHMRLLSSYRGITMTYPVSEAALRDIMVIGDLQTPSMPIAVPVYELEELFALQIDGYLIVPGSRIEALASVAGVSDIPSFADETGSYTQWAQEWNSFFIDVLQGVSLFSVWRQRDMIPSILSNVEPSGVYAFARAVQELPDDAISPLVVSSDLLVRGVDERGGDVDMITTGALDSVLTGLERDERIEREQARIEVFNGTSIDGLGSRVERWIRHVGGEVIRVKNAPGRSQESVLYVTDADEYAYTVSRISGLFESIRIVEGRPEFITTGDITVIIGIDF